MENRRENHLNRIFNCEDNNIASLRERYPDGLHFVVGDTHGQCTTLMALMDKIQFDPEKDHVYFVGDYNAGGHVRTLLTYMAQYYEADYEKPGFHMIRGNHERELCPDYYLENLPDILVLRGKTRNYFIAHAGMVYKAFLLINREMQQYPEQKVFAYKLADQCVEYYGPLRQVIWSRNGLYSQRSREHLWPTERCLVQNRACIIHGHTPYSFLKKGNHFSYGYKNMLWGSQHVFFSEDLQGFDIDSDVKGRCEGGETYRGLSCMCLEVYEELSSRYGGKLTIEDIRAGENGIFGQPLVTSWRNPGDGDIDKILQARPRMKVIGMDAERKLKIW